MHVFTEVGASPCVLPRLGSPASFTWVTLWHGSGPLIHGHSLYRRKDRVSLPVEGERKSAWRVRLRGVHRALAFQNWASGGASTISAAFRCEWLAVVRQVAGQYRLHLSFQQLSDSHCLRVALLLLVEVACRCRLHLSLQQLSMRIAYATVARRIDAVGRVASHSRLLLSFQQLFDTNLCAWRRFRWRRSGAIADRFSCDVISRQMHVRRFEP